MEGVAREMARSLGSARREAAAHRLALRKKRKAASSKTCWPERFSGNDIVEVWHDPRRQ